MIREQLIDACLHSFEENFANNWAEKVVSTQSLPILWELIEKSGTFGFSKQDLAKFEFRLAYILEYVYFRDSKSFEPYIHPFFEMFPAVANGSMRRHFGKICYWALKKGDYPHNAEAIATACVDWVIDPKTRVAVKVWALDILSEFSKTESWVKELFNEILDSQSINPTQGMLVRIRRIKELY